MAISSGQDDNGESFLLTMPNEILHRIFEWALDSPCSDFGGIKGAKLRNTNGFSRTCRHFRDICSPTMFHTVNIRGNAAEALARSEALLQCMSFGNHVR